MNTFQYNICYCSIILIAFRSNGSPSFQYNICYCSIMEKFHLTILFSNFNTTSVIVQLSLVRKLFVCSTFQYNICYCSICFNKVTAVLSSKFQYNICYCSIQDNPKIMLIFPHFNTTSVIVQSN